MFCTNPRGETGAQLPLAPQLSLRMRLPYSLQTILGRNHSGFFPLRNGNIQNWSPTAKFKTYFPPSLASTQSSGPTDRRTAEEQVQVMGSNKRVWREASPGEAEHPHMGLVKGDEEQTGARRLSARTPAAG